MSFSIVNQITRQRQYSWAQRHLNDLQWWVHHLARCKGQGSGPHHQIRCGNQPGGGGWGAVCRNQSDGGHCSRKEQRLTCSSCRLLEFSLLNDKAYILIFCMYQATFSYHRKTRVSLLAKIVRKRFLITFNILFSSVHKILNNSFSNYLTSKPVAFLFLSYHHFSSSTLHYGCLSICQLFF